MKCTKSVMHVQSCKVVLLIKPIVFFFFYVLVAVASLDLKVPGRERRQRQRLRRRQRERQKGIGFNQVNPSEALFTYRNIWLYYK